MTNQPFSERRSFLARWSLGAAAVLPGRIARAQVKTSGARFEPARHDKDDWMDQLPGKHRLVFDTIHANGLGDSLAFANNFFVANRTDYGLQNGDLAVIVILRHLSTVFGFNDAMWNKYGAPIARMAQFSDPETNEAPKSNLYNAPRRSQLANFGVTLDAMSKLGVQFAVCAMATRRVAGSAAQAVSGNADAINAELIANLVANARMVPAGIVVASRAQERGYTLVSADRMS